MRVSRGPVIAVASVLVLVVAVFGWFELRNRISSEGSAAAGTCVEGSSVLHIAADPDIEPVIASLARTYADTSPVVRDHCLTIDVRSSASADVADSLSKGTWDPALGNQPALWIPQSTTSITDLGRTNVVDGTPKSIATSPVVLAVPATLAGPLAKANVGWKDLTGLQGASSLDPLGLAGWGSLRLVFPTGTPSESTSLALNAIDSAMLSLGATSPDLIQAGSADTRTAISTLGVLDTGSTSSAAAQDNRNTADVLTSLEGAASPAAPIHAVPISEHELVDSKPTNLSAFYPSGPTPVMDYPAAILSGSWVDATQSLAAAQFVDFVRQQNQANVLIATGFRAGGETPRSTSTVAFSPVDAPMSPMVSGVASLLRDQVAHPARPLRSTVLLDSSKAMAVVDGSATRLQNVATVLSQHIGTALNSSDLGLWVYSKDLNGSSPFRVAVPTLPLTDAQRAALASSITSARPTGDTYAYMSLLAAYADAVGHYTPGLRNSVLLITGGADNDPGVPGRQLLDVITAAMDPARPVSLDVVSIGSTADSATLQSLASRTGGTFTAVPSSDRPELATAIAAALGAS